MIIMYHLRACMWCLHDHDALYYAIIIWIILYDSKLVQLKCTICYTHISLCYICLLMYYKYNILL